MEIYLHIGLAKTGTTFIQTICEKNLHSLLSHGCAYLPRSHYACWPLLAGDPGPALEQLERAAAIGTRAVFLSCEDYAALAFHPSLALDFIDRIKARLTKDITIAVHIRRQDELFWSLYSTLSINMFTEPFYMFHEALRQGYYCVVNTHDRSGLAPYYYFCFDHDRHLGHFFNILRSHDPDLRLRIYDYDAEGRFPGRQLFQEMGALPALKQLPAPEEENRRRSADQTAAGFSENFAKLVPADFAQEARALIEARAVVPEGLRRAMSRVLMDRFSDGNDRLLQRFAPDSPAQDGRDAPSAAPADADARGRGSV